MNIKDMTYKTDEHSGSLIEVLSDDGYENLRMLDDGTIVGTSKLLYTTAVYIDLNRHGWEKRFCFQDKELAIAEVNKLQSGDDEPVGYIARRNG